MTGVDSVSEVKTSLDLTLEMLLISDMAGGVLYEYCRVDFPVRL